MVCLPSPNYNKRHLLYNMHGPIFVAVAQALEIKPCRKSCLAGIKNPQLKSVRNLVTKLGSSASRQAREDVKNRLLMCCYFPNQSTILNWPEFAHHMTEGEVSEELQELFDQWRQKNHRRATTLLQAIVLALRANPPLTCEQATFCFDPLPQLLVGKMVNLLYRLLDRSCVKVTVKDTTTFGHKILAVQFTDDQTTPAIYCS